MDMKVSGTGIEMGEKIENGVKWNECICMWWIREMRRMGNEIDSMGVRIWVGWCVHGASRGEERKVNGKKNE